MLGRVWGDYLLPLFAQFEMTHVIKRDSSVPDEDVTPEYMAEHVWLIGSPDTVEKKPAGIVRNVRWLRHSADPDLRQHGEPGRLGKVHESLRPRGNAPLSRPCAGVEGRRRLRLYQGGVR